MKKVLFLFLLVGLCSILLLSFTACNGDRIENGETDAESGNTNTDKDNSDGENENTDTEKDNSDGENTDTEKDNSDGENENTDTPFDYKTLDLDLCLPDFSASDVTGKVIAGAAFKVAPVKDSDVFDYINYFLLEKAVPDDEGKASQTTPIDHADHVGIYVLAVTKNGVPLKTAYFNNAYAQVGEITVGAAAFGKAFDDALIGRIPKDCGSVEFVKTGKIADGDVLCVTYELTLDGESAPCETYTFDRWDLSALPEAKRVAVLANAEEIGKEFTFSVYEDVNENGKEELVHYKATVSAIAKEKDVCVIRAALPEDFFDESATEVCKALNGQTLEFHVIIDYSVAYTAVADCYEELTADDIKYGLGFAHETTGNTPEEKDANAREALFAFVKSYLLEEYDYTVRENGVSLIWAHLKETVSFASIPEKAIEMHTEDLIDSIEGMYEGYSAYEGFLEEYPTIDAYAQFVFGYSGADYADYKQYAYEEAGEICKQYILYYAIFEKLGVRDDEDGYWATKDAILDSIIADFAEQGISMSRSDAVNYLKREYGENYLEEWIMIQMVDAYLLENNTVDWER